MYNPNIDIHTETEHSIRIEEDDQLGDNEEEVN